MITTLVLALLGALGGLFFFRSKNKSNEALVENVATKEELLKKDQEIAKNNGLLQAEEVKRAQLEEDIKKEQDEPLTTDQVIDFFNRRK